MSYNGGIKAKVISFLFIGIIGLLIANSAYFAHLHKLDNGSVISHAHPYNKSQDPAPYKSHHHTKTELALIHHLQLFLFIGFIHFAFLKGVIKQVYVEYVKSINLQFSFYSHQVRAPPTSFLNLHFS